MDSNPQHHDLTPEQEAELERQRQEAIGRARELGIPIGAPAAPAAAPQTPPQPPQDDAALVGDITTGLPDLEAHGGADGVGAPGEKPAEGDDDEPMGGAITIGGTRYDVGDLTLGEVETLEEVVGAGFGEIDYGRIKNLRVMLWLLRQRDDPSYTLEDARNITLNDPTGAQRAAQAAQAAISGSGETVRAAAKQADVLAEHQRLEALEHGPGADPSQPAP